MMMYIQVFILRALDQPYGSPKLREMFDSVLEFRPILSSIGTYNYQVAKFLGKLLDYVIPNDHSIKDTFSFVEELKR